MNKIFFIFASFLVGFMLTGCVSVKIVAKRELLNENQKRNVTLENISVGVLKSVDELRNQRRADYVFNQFINNLNKAKVFKRVEIATPTDKWPDILISNIQDNSPLIGEGFQCFEPYLYAFSIGIIPQICKMNHILSFNISNPRRKDSILIEEAYLKKAAAGWLAFLLTPSEKGKFNGSEVEYFKALFNHHASKIQRLYGTNKE